jgi:SiaC family regulatory phosphoprotein
MEHLVIESTDRSPAVVFDFENHRLKISGESYPEDATAFYHPIFEALDTFLGKPNSGACRFDFELIYFNSSSAKAIMIIMEKLDEAAKNGVKIDVHWYYDEEDDTMQELGEEFGEDLIHATFHLEKMTA